jgi:hypothetical protein
MEETKTLKPCQFCGGKASISVSDDEGNQRDEEYEKDPWSGLSFKIQHGHESNKNCPIANFEEDGGTVGVYLYDSREEAIEAWNTRL